jgi:hypothetical protein
LTSRFSSLKIEAWRLPMKKLLFMLGVVLLLVLGCETKYYPVSITNNTAKSVSYTYDDVSDTLPASQSKTYEVKAYTQPPKDFIDENKIASLKMEQKGDSFTFIPATPLDLKVINKLPIDITIKADNFIDNNGSMELEIKKDTESTGAKIYTKNPRFTSTSNYPIVYEWAVVENEMSVVIR